MQHERGKEWPLTIAKCSDSNARGLWSTSVVDLGGEGEVMFKNSAALVIVLGIIGLACDKDNKTSSSATKPASQGTNVVSGPAAPAEATPSAAQTAGAPSANAPGASGGQAPANPSADPNPSP